MRILYSDINKFNDSIKVRVTSYKKCYYKNKIHELNKKLP